MSRPFRIRPARREDAARICALVRDLARYEKLESEMVATPEDFAAALFAEHPRVFCDVAELEGAEGGEAVVGFALWFYNFSTFLGRNGIWLEDLYVRPEMRGSGIGKALLAGLARRCLDERLGRLEWWVLDWNEPALAVYRSIGARPMEGWTVQRMTGEALETLAKA